MQKQRREAKPTLKGLKALLNVLVGFDFFFWIFLIKFWQTLGLKRVSTSIKNIKIDECILMMWAQHWHTPLGKTCSQAFRPICFRIQSRYRFVSLSLSDFESYPEMYAPSRNAARRGHPRRCTKIVSTSDNKSSQKSIEKSMPMLIASEISFFRSQNQVSNKRRSENV